MYISPPSFAEMSENYHFSEFEHHAEMAESERFIGKNEWLQAWQALQI